MDTNEPEWGSIRDRVWGAMLFYHFIWVVRECLKKAVAPEQRPNEGKETNSVYIWGKNIRGRRTDSVVALQLSGVRVLKTTQDASEAAEQG